MTDFSKDFTSAAEASAVYTRKDLDDALENEDAPLVQQILASGQVTDLETQTDRGWTPLLLALNSNNRECVLAVMDAGANLNATIGNMNQTPLGYAVGDYYGGSPLMVSLLLARGADPNLLPINPHEGPLLTAAKDGKEAIVILLLQNGANIEQKDTWGNTAANIAAKNGHGGIIRILAEHGANLDNPGSGNETPLERAIAGRSREAFDALLECGADPAVGNQRYGRTLLMAAAAHGETGVMERLLAAGLDIDFQDKEGKSALMHAAGEGKKDAVRRLLELGANPAVSNGKTAREIADEKGYFHVVQEIDTVLKRLAGQQKPAPSARPLRLALGPKGGSGT